MDFAWIALIGALFAGTLALVLVCALLSVKK